MWTRRRRDCHTVGCRTPCHLMRDRTARVPRRRAKSPHRQRGEMRHEVYAGHQLKPNRSPSTNTPTPPKRDPMEPHTGPMRLISMRSTILADLLRLRTLAVTMLCLALAWMLLPASSPQFMTAQAWAAPSTSAVSGSPVSRPPLPSKVLVLTRFSVGEHRWSAGHRGVDLAAPPGAAISAVGPATVHFAGMVAGRPVVSLLHPDGLITTYEPVTASVRRGDRVQPGAVIGTLVAGHASCAPRTCVHWGARRGSGRSAEYLDPLALLGAITNRLKPL